MTNEEAAKKLIHWAYNGGVQNGEAFDLAIAALRSPAPGAEAMREAAAKVAEKGSVLGSKRIDDPAMVDAWMSGVVDAQVQTAAAIRALPAPEVPRPETPGERLKRIPTRPTSRTRGPTMSDRAEQVAAALALATRFHEAYERLAPSFGYETREETRTFDPESKNGRLMVAVCGEILRESQPEPATPAPEVPEVIQTWCKNYDATEDCGGLNWARNSRLRDHFREEYGICPAPNL